MTDAPAVFDPAQLIRIESVHRGFLYQHLYAVACLLRLASSGATALVVEADEDLELVLADRHLYVQIKTRGESLGESDIASAVKRFGQLRDEHARGTRPGSSSFVIVSNIAPGPKLLKSVNSINWPADVQLVWPHNPPTDIALPHPWHNTEEALIKCSELASSLPFAKLAPDTLVLKLAAAVMAAAAGIPPRENHAFQADETAELFEQLVIQLQEFPLPPPVYRPQAHEPDLVSKLPIRIIAGFSGAGKTAWVAQASLHSNTEIAYFDIGDTPNTAIAIPLARELAGRFFGKGGALGEILLPGATGLDMLRALARKLNAEGIEATVVVDNAHRATADSLHEIMHSTPGIRYLLLCQPGLTVQTLQAEHGLSVESLKGWTTDTIATDTAAVGCKPTPASAQRLLDLTGGLPLYVQNAARIAAKDYGGDLAAFCADLERQTHSVSTAQEIILARTFENFNETARDALSVVAISDMPLEHSETAELLKTALSFDETATARFVRELRPTGAIEIFGKDRIKVHDAMRLLGRIRLNTLDKDLQRRAYLALRNILLTSVTKERNLGRLSLLVKVFAEIGEIRPLVEIATDEIFHELGVVQQIYGTLETASVSDAVNPEQQFAALDGLVFADLKGGDIDSAAKHLDLMAKICANHVLDVSDRLTLAMKQMLFAAARNDGQGVAKKLEQISALLPDSAIHRRIFRYNAAHALYQLGRYEDCIAETEHLIPEYYDVLALDVGEIIGKNPDKIFPLLAKDKDHTDDLKHLADCLDLQAQALNRAGRYSPLGRIHAMKFFAMANAIDSVVRVGQDLADEFISRNDYIGARDVLERNVLPNVIGLKMTSHIVPVRAQYAVILAFCGDHSAAEREMEALQPYEAGLSAEQREGLKGQRALIEKLRRSPPPPQWQMSTFLQPGQTGAPRKMGRNEPCYCGSGLKYKRCHGKSA